MLEVGRIGKPNGVRGDANVILFTDRVERVAVGAQLLARTARGEHELVVERSRKHNDRWVVHFVGIDTRNDIEPLVNATLYAEPIDDPDALWVHELIGSRVVTLDGRECGTCESVISNPAHAILELSSGALIPIPFVVSNIDGVITINPPEGLLDGE